MDVKNYISSGILERYVFGEVSSQEKQEVACLSKIYPEIQKELFAHQLGVEKMVSKYSVTPPQELKQQILLKVSNTSQDHSTTEDKDEKIISINRTNQKLESNKNIYKYLAAACSVGMILLLAGGFYLNNLNTDLKGTIAANDNKITDLEGDYNQMAATNESINQKFEIVTSASTSKILMKGTESQPTSLANVFVSEENENVYLQVGNLPGISENNDYQLWAIVDGKPESLGVFNTENKEELLEMKYFPKAQAYAVTLEPKGGSESPTMENMYVYGGV
ncbi:anti-sigma factor [Brumimicrobium glaciale]|uniref:Anti-sigma factor n=1 Tax=Brumimicrobium glaciale TaxID=200475 RepID=A0A4Q4KSF1_9FLAO|nr:anti-sigma factor [Brumimicrobium glaciale]RYM34969.1 anti-sigma factor [Brumimicrobium glaciale]